MSAGNTCPIVSATKWFTIGYMKNYMHTRSVHVMSAQDVMSETCPRTLCATISFQHFWFHRLLWLKVAGVWGSSALTVAVAWSSLTWNYALELIHLTQYCTGLKNMLVAFAFPSKIWKLLIDPSSTVAKMTDPFLSYRLLCETSELEKRTTAC